MKADVLELLEVKNFEELTDEERTAVLKEMSESEYRAHRKLILTALVLTKKEKVELIPNSQILIMAKERMSKKKAGGLMIFQHKVPTWAAAAACLLLFFGIRNLNNLENSGAETTVVTEIFRDTVYTEKIVTTQLLADTVIEYIYINQPEVIHEAVDNSSNYVQEDPSFENLNFREYQDCSIMSCYEPKKGMSVANDTLLVWTQNGLY